MIFRSHIIKNQYLFLALLPLLLFPFIGLVFHFLSFNLLGLAIAGDVYLFSVFFIWLYKFILKQKSEILCFRFWISILLGLLVLAWFFSYKATAHVSYGVALLCTIYGIIKKNFQHISLSLIFLFLYATLQFIGLFWAKDIDFIENKWIIEDQIPILLLPIVLVFYRLKPKEISTFCTILFKFCLLLLVWYLVAYLLICLENNMNFLKCFSFNKLYFSSQSFSPYSVLCFHFQKHYSFIAWFLTITAGTAYATFRQDKSKIITRWELITYFILLFFLINILQVRLAQIVYFILLFTIFCFERLKSWNYRNLILSLLSFLVIGIFALIFLVRNTSFFHDETRHILYSKSIEYIQRSPWWGNGTLSEQVAISETKLDSDSFKHPHNDFLMAGIRHGLLGISLLSLFLATYAWESLRAKDYRAFFFLIPTFFIMLVDSALFYQRTIALTCLFIGVLYLPPRKNLT